VTGSFDPKDPESDRGLRRRRVVVVATLTVGAVLLGISLRVRPGDPQFLWSALALAGAWTAGGLLSGPLPLGQVESERGRRRPILAPILAPIVVGAVLGAVFLAGAFLVREIPPLRQLTSSVLAYAGGGALLPVTVVTVVNAVAEEIFFRGALFAAVGRRHAVLFTTLIYTLTTVATGNPMLVFAAIIVGTVLAWQRRSTGGVLAPILTHVTWSLLMLYALPPLLGP
jgi:membrane protease YdiL (CAAX protease family)